MVLYCNKSQYYRVIKINFQVFLNLNVRLLLINKKKIKIIISS